MKAIAFFNNKGGVGKTTLLCNLAANLALNKGKSVLVIDADPQCNATQSIFTDDQITKTYSDESSFTVFSLVKPLSQGIGYAKEFSPISSSNFGVDLIPGDPRLALTEDTLAGDWKDAISGDIRGIRTTFLFSEMLSKCDDYDFVFFDMGPSLGSINRAVLIGCDYFLSPMSIDIFSLRAIENIATSILKWKRDILRGLESVESKDDIPSYIDMTIRLQFIGYVTQQYTAKRISGGERRAVKAYDKIMEQIPKKIKADFVDKLQPDKDYINYQLGSVPNLHSLVPLSQNNRKPIGELKAKDGVVGAHFTKVEEAKQIFDQISFRMLENVGQL